MTLRSALHRVEEPILRESLKQASESGFVCACIDFGGPELWPDLPFKYYTARTLRGEAENVEIVSVERPSKQGASWQITADRLAVTVARDGGATLILITVSAATPLLNDFLSHLPPSVAAVYIRSAPSELEPLGELVQEHIKENAGVHGFVALDHQAAGILITSSQALLRTITSNADELDRRTSFPKDENADLFKVSECWLSNDEVFGKITAPYAHPLPYALLTCGGDSIGISRLSPDAVTPNLYHFRLQVPRHIYYDSSAGVLGVHLCQTKKSSSAAFISLPPSRSISAEALLTLDTSDRLGRGLVQGFGALLLPKGYYGDVAIDLMNQGASVEAWVDADHVASNHPSDVRVTRREGRLGENRLAIEALLHMSASYDRFIMLMDGNVPQHFAVEEFKAALDSHHFDSHSVIVLGGPGSGLGLPVLWATWSERISPLLRELFYLYTLPEPEYLDWAREALSLTSATISAPRAFLWSEALNLLLMWEGKHQGITSRPCVFAGGQGT